MGRSLDPARYGPLALARVAQARHNLPMALLLLMALALPARAEPLSCDAQRITEARLSLAREQLPLVLALPADVPQAVQDPQCAEPYKTYREALDRWCGGESDPRTLALLRQG